MTAGARELLSFVQATPASHFTPARPFADEDSQIIRARDITFAALDNAGNVTARLAAGDGVVVTVAGQRAHGDERRPGDFHRQLVRMIEEVSDAAGAFLLRAVYDETRGWHWVSEQL